MTSSPHHPVFKTAVDNMAYDEKLLKQLLQPDFSATHVLRTYLWPDIPGITYPGRIEPPSGLQHYDHSSRITGGGIVFHCPGDILFTYAAQYSKPIKPVLELFKTLIKNNLNHHGINVSEADSPPGKTHLDFCATYHSPYELYVHHHKILGLAVRRFKNTFIIQGILHNQPTAAFFQNLTPDFHTYFTEGLGESALSVSMLQFLEHTGDFPLQELIKRTL